MTLDERKAHAFDWLQEWIKQKREIYFNETEKEWVLSLDEYSEASFTGSTLLEAVEKAMAEEKR